MNAIAYLLIANQFSFSPYSGNALSTGIVGFRFVSGFFYVYAKRFESFYRRLTEANRQLRRLASTDAFTGLLNPRTFYTVCDRMLALAKREKSPFSVLFIDLDQFKKISITASVGVAHNLPHLETMASIQREADTAMY
jgi:PleD family two-component response regulator